MRCSCLTFFFFSSRRRHTRFDCDWSSDVCSSDLFAAMYLSFNSTILEENQVTDFLIRIIQPRLSALPGVQKADILGGRTFAMRIRSEERRVGKECRSRWGLYLSKKTT